LAENSQEPDKNRSGAGKEKVWNWAGHSQRLDKEQPRVKQGTDMNQIRNSPDLTGKSQETGRE
jgi:hypothetical protein